MALAARRRQNSQARGPRYVAQGVLAGEFGRRPAARNASPATKLFILRVDEGRGPLFNWRHETVSPYLLRRLAGRLCIQAPQRAAIGSSAARPRRSSFSG